MATYWHRLEGIGAYGALLSPVIFGLLSITLADTYPLIVVILPVGGWAICMGVNKFAIYRAEAEWLAGEPERDRAWCEFMRKSER